MSSSSHQLKEPISSLFTRLEIDAKWVTKFADEEVYTINDLLQLSDVNLATIVKPLVTMRRRYENSSILQCLPEPLLNGLIAFPSFHHYVMRTDLVLLRGN
jgi:hypothetical protein